MKELRPAIVLFLAFTVICGGIYPAIVTSIATVAFPDQAAGSLIRDDQGRITGSRLIGQPFTADGYLWPRPSATTDFPYNPLASGGSNAGPTNPEYLKIVRDRVRVFRASGITGPIPSELVQASASGLDPHLSPEGAYLQIPRIARARSMNEATLRRLIATHIEERQFGIFGAPRVNVLAVNRELAKLRP